ncbi:MAG: hypothetical protein A2066_00080 [Bacteroidetes bacterium GWB2_41_8]|nr:MAG: hypothetical protein A2066_00080 [Bacteroidetes bacterium GWB2_41_8]
MRTGDEYSESVFEFLDEAEVGKSFTIENLCKEENRVQFIEAVKLYISSYDYGGGWEFNTDYTKIRRIEIPIEAWRDLWKYKRLQNQKKNQS